MVLTVCGFVCLWIGLFVVLSVSGFVCPHVVSVYFYSFVLLFCLSVWFLSVGELQMGFQDVALLSS